ncbi:MAG: hypothetical protein GTN45_11290 [Xanthomonadales bacterium]|nr:hypothetical protein [Xanthomonadales bacterium]
MMKTTFYWVMPVLLLTLATPGPAQAEVPARETLVVALKTDAFELAETDVSELAVGESRTIVTDGGKTIELLRTDEGVDIYVDGELLQLGIDPAGETGHRTVHQRIEVHCESPEQCEEWAWVSEDGEVLHHAIHEELAVECSEAEECEQHWVHRLDDSELADGHDAPGTHRVIRIHRSEGDEAEIHAHEAEVYVIRKRVTEGDGAGDD